MTFLLNLRVLRIQNNASFSLLHPKISFMPYPFSLTMLSDPKNFLPAFSWKSSMGNRTPSKSNAMLRENQVDEKLFSIHSVPSDFSVIPTQCYI